MKTQDERVRDRLRRAEGQLRGIIRMIEEGRSCEDVVTQLTAVRHAIGRATEELITAHIDECVNTLPPDEMRERVGRAVRLLARRD
ncbi:MAG TPA: metal-sensitive transcriptional regulator [Chloroflexota bacterium]|nr:metal-sensitive transcriptional regulator [Chloroflexota bacterium]